MEADDSYLGDGVVPFVNDMSVVFVIELLGFVGILIPGSTFKAGLETGMVDTLLEGREDRNDE